MLHREVVVALRGVYLHADALDGLLPEEAVVVHRVVHALAIRLELRAERLGEVAAHEGFRDRRSEARECGDGLAGPPAIGGDVEVGDEPEGIRRLPRARVDLGGHRGEVVGQGLGRVRRSEHGARALRHQTGGQGGAAAEEPPTRHALGTPSINGPSRPEN